MTATGEPVIVDIELGDLDVRPSTIDVPAGSEVIVNVTNAGAMEHDLKLEGQAGTDMILPGGKVTASLGVVNETTQAWCTVPATRKVGWCWTST